MSVTPEQLRQTFYTVPGASGVFAHTETAALQSPAFLIARIAFGDRVAEPLVQDEDVTTEAGGKWLRIIEEVLDAPRGFDVSLNPSEAGELAELGQQILELNDEGAVQHPLSEDETAGITHVISVVGSLPAMAARP